VGGEVRCCVKAIELIRAKVERGNDHIRDLEAAVTEFVKGYKVTPKPDPNLGLVYTLTSGDDPPPRLSAIAGDAISNLRGALDHLAYQLVLKGSGATPSTSTCFPIAQNASDYKTKAARTLRGAPPGAFSAIDALKPYKGGNDALWRLHELSNIDKHRMIVTVGSYFGGFNSKGAGLLRMRPGTPFRALKVGDGLFAPPSDTSRHRCLMKRLVALLTPSVKFYFNFGVVLDEPGVIAEPQPVVKTLKQMSRLVDGIISDLARFL